MYAHAAFGESVSTWQEGAENGYAHVIDGTSGDYSLIQSEVSGRGSYAFHLATPDPFADDYFEIDADIDVQADTKLYFLSRLQHASSNQFAKVQLSSDGGQTWLITLYSQAGDGSGGEGGFVLREIDLGASYSNQQVRIRFIYDFSGGSYFPQTSTNVGWLIDDIRINTSYPKQVWDIGDPSAYEVLYLELINRARADALVEAARLANSNDNDIEEAIDFYNISSADIIAQFQHSIDEAWMPQSAQPLAFNASLMEAANKHSQDMAQNGFQGHISSSSPIAPFQAGDSFSTRMARIGYYFAAGENVYASGKSVEHSHAGFGIDWGNLEDANSPYYNLDFVGQGMQNPAGHRLNIHNGSFNEAGIGVITGVSGSFGPQIVTQDLGGNTSISYVTGVIYNDVNSDNFYSMQDASNHEGVGGVRIDIDGLAYYTLSTASGAYALPVIADGTYTVTFSGVGIETYTTSVIVSGGQNVKLDHDPVALTGYALWESQNGLSFGAAGDDDGDRIPNLIEYALAGMDPGSSDAQNAPSLTHDNDGKRRFSVNKRAGVTGISYEVQVSTSLAPNSWQAAGALAGTAVEVDDAGELIVAIDASIEHLFIRLRVIEQEP